jgi:hypothetical protein
VPAQATARSTLVAQSLCHDGVAIILDFRRASHQWAFGLPNVTPAATPRAMTIPRLP